MKYASYMPDKEALRKQHKVNPVGKRLHCWSCGFLADSEKEDFEGRKPRLRVSVYWCDTGQLWRTSIYGRCPRCKRHAETLTASFTREPYGF